MSFIDKKGRLFGRISIIDLFFLFFILLSLIFLYKLSVLSPLLGAGPPVPPPQNLVRTEFLLTLVIENVRPEIATIIEKEFPSVTSKPTEIPLISPTGEIKLIPHPENKDFYIKKLVEPKEKIKVGITIPIETPELKLVGTVISIDMKKTWDEALRVYREAIARKPKDARAHFFLGEVYAKKNMLDETLVQFEKSLELSSFKLDIDPSKIDERTTELIYDSMIKMDIVPPDFRGAIEKFSLEQIVTFLKLAGVKIITDGKIGRTEVISPVNIIVQSAGFTSGNFAHIYINGVDVSPNQRGYNLATLDADTGKIEEVALFDTCASYDDVYRMIKFIEALPKGEIVVAAVKDEASGKLNARALEALLSIGVSRNVLGLHRYSHVIIGVKGAEKATTLDTVNIGPSEIILLNIGI